MSLPTSEKSLRVPETGVAGEPPILSIRGMTTSFDGRIIHDDLDLDVRLGEVLVLLGGSGAGKSTLLRCLIGLEIPDNGVCWFAGRDIFKLDAKEWPAVRQQIAYAFQTGALFDSLTVEENLDFPLREHTRLGPRERHERVTAMLARLGLAQCETLYPAALSGGMQKRVGLARAVILEPAIILYDEPTAGLDPANVRRINETILTLKHQGKTSIVVTHDEACARAVADRYALIRGGKIDVVQTRQEFERDPAPQLAEYFSGKET